MRNPRAHRADGARSNLRLRSAHAAAFLLMLLCIAQSSQAGSTVGLGWDGAEFTEEERTAVRSWLSGKAGSIYGGSNEVQNNIISKRILGLPDLTQSH